MSDSGKFESVVSSILRRADPYYESVIQTGINPEGKPVKDPVDGIGWVKGSDNPHYIFFEYTTTKKAGLISKWLADPDSDSSQDKGDLIKAAERADEIREGSPSAEFTVVLVSNKDLDSDLVTKVKSEADKHDVSVDIWGVHRLSDFLHNDPDGQWIRQNEFGIEAERLSEPLLLEIGEKSLSAYQEEFRVEVEELRVQRPELSTILETAESSSPGNHLIPLVGNSGFGKTVTSYQAMENWLAEETPTLRVRPSDVEASASLTQALQSALSRHHVSLTSTAGQEAIRIASKNGRLLVVVDDLNRANDPTHLFKRISNWVGKMPDGGDSETEEFPVAIICPLWQRIWDRHKRNIQYNKFADPVELGPLLSDTAVELIQSQADVHGVNITEDAAHDLVEKVGGDPHIIGLLGKLMENENSVADLPKASKDVIRDFVNQSYDTASAASSESFIAADYNLAVEDLSINVLEKRDLEPGWRSVRNWISGSENVKAVRELTQQAQLLFIVHRKEERILSYRHDRVRDYLLSAYTFDRLSRNENTSYISDPYYYSILGKGIAYFRPPEDVLSQLCEKNPLALFEALRELGGDASDYEDKLNTELQQWLDEQGNPTNLPSSLLWKSIEIVQEMDSRKVCELTESFPDWPQVLLARFRNGDLDAGIQFCNQRDSGNPNTNFSQRDTVMEEVRLRWGEQYTEEFSTRFETIGEENISGAIQLAGFIGKSGLLPGIKDAWKKFGDEDGLLPVFIWAAFQCGLPDDSSFVNKVFSRWASLPSTHEVEREDEAGNNDGVTKGRVYSAVKFALARDISKRQIKYLYEAIDEFPELEYHLVLLLQNIADPDALEVAVRKMGEFQHEAEGHGPIHLSSELSRQWDPNAMRGRSLPASCKARLRNLWTDEDELDETRRLAFRTWSKAAQVEELEILQDMSNNELFEYRAHYRRLELGDQSVFHSSAFDIIETPSYLQAISRTWSSEAYELVDEILATVDPDDEQDLFYQLGRFLFRIPDSDAEQLLEAHWDRIGNRPTFFQAALYTATPLSRDLANQTYEQTDNPGKLLEHVRMNFGFNTYGRSELISEKHLVSLEPYLDHIREMDLIEIAHKAKEIGMMEWSASNVQPLMSEHRYSAHPTDEDLFDRLDEIEDDGDHRIDIKVWMDEFDRRAEPKSRAFHILEQWLKKDTNLDRYNIVAKVIKNRGTREHLSILDNVSEDIGDDQVGAIYEDAEIGVKTRTLH
ncbi:hypothetical protein [Saliphagus sp. LR7]|uniref:hypothetical protein n=1 Tax=Saliphagus sp. LR7 TaxID=2282654 RepID=UPI001300221F|nr:hypothetical protein [Saliphagus sp. LR7]